MPSQRDRQHTLLQTTLHAAALVLLAGTMASVSLAQEGKDAKDPKTGQPAPPAPARAPRDPKVSGKAQPQNPSVLPTNNDGKAAPAAANPKTGQPVTGKEASHQSAGKEQPAGKANPTPTPTPTPAAPTAATVTPGGDAPPTVTEHDFGPVPDGHFRFGPFSEAVDVKVLVDMVAEHLKIQIISTDTALRDKKIQLYTPVDVPEDELLEFLGLLLDQNGQYIRKETIGDKLYAIEPRPEAGGNKGTTQVVATRGLKPSSLAQAIAQVLKGGPGSTATPGVQQGNQQGPANIAYLDDLGVLVITDTPRRIAAVKDLVEELSNEQIQLVFTRFDVHNVSAAIAKQRMLELLGQSQRTNTNVAFNPNNPDGGQPINNPVLSAGGGTSTSNIATRLIPDAQSNALTLRGRPEEVELITRLLKVVDVPNQLVPKWYAVGPAAQALAEQGKRAGLGEVTAMQSTRGGNNQNLNNQGGFFQDDGSGFGGGFNNRFNQNNLTASGPVFVLDADQRGFMYYGTPQQHTQLDKLVKEFAEITQSERVVYEFYKLRFVDAEKASDLIRGMINNTVPGGESPLIPGAPGGQGSRRNSVGAQQNVANNASSSGGGGLDEIIATDQVHVLADKSNNQVVVKAPQRLQAQFARLIDKIDLRRPQVYIDAKIIVVTNNDDFKFAVETQLVNAGGSGGVLRTLFPGGTATGGNILTPPTVNAPAASVGGIAAAVILSDYVPIIINAVASNGSGRVVASPQLLVDDNEEAVISSINQQPTTTQSTTNDDVITSFGGYQDAGPKLTIKPRLSTGDLLSLKYEVELSSFRGDSVGGIPPAKDVANVKSDSVTLPSDSTIVVGGLEFSQKDNTVVKVPFLGDIPLVGELFKSTSNSEDRRTIYVFITPRIMRDPIGNDLRYISEGPARRADNENSLPPVQLQLIEVGGGARTLPPQPKPGTGLGADNPIDPKVTPEAPIPSAPPDAPNPPPAPAPTTPQP